MNTNTQHDGDLGTCDNGSCPAPALVKAWVDKAHGLALSFCGHHYREHTPTLYEHKCLVDVDMREDGQR